MIPSVPPFVISADEIIRNMNRTNSSNDLGYYQFGSDSSSPVHPARKRMIEGNAFHFTSSKKLKVQSPKSPMIEDRIVIDLTEDTPMESSPARLYSPRPVLANTTNQASQASIKEPARKRPDQHERSVTTSALHRIVNRLRSNEAAIDKDRDILRKRWDMDMNLQLQTVTDHLLELNECFKRAEDGIRDALTIINERLLSG